MVRIVATSETYYFRNQDVLWYNPTDQTLRHVRLGSIGGSITGINTTDFLQAGNIWLSKKRLNVDDIYIRTRQGDTTKLLNFCGTNVTLSPSVDIDALMVEIEAIKNESKIKLVARKV